MIRECWWWLTTPCPGWARRCGLLAESCAIGARARRCAAAWAPHLARCRRLIAAHAPAGGRIAVLGSGWLNDVPVDELAACCAQVALVDGVHPAPARRAARRHANVALVHADLSGLNHGEPRAEVRAPDWAGLGLAAPDLAVSVCTLSQLAHAPLAALARQGVGEAACARLGREVRAAHLALLAGARAALLITDTAVRDQDGTFDLLDGLDLGPAQESWEWPVAPPGERSDGGFSLHQVGVWTSLPC